MNDSVSRENKRFLPQFWYTWSNVGFGDLKGGYRIRAVSRELTDIDSNRVKLLDRHARYALPSSTNRYDDILTEGMKYYTLPPTKDEQLKQKLARIGNDLDSIGKKLLSIEGAPICLSFAHTDSFHPDRGERILVNNIFIYLSRNLFRMDFSKTINIF